MNKNVYLQWCCPFLFLFLSCACQLTSGLPFRSTLEAIATREDQRVGVEEIFPYMEYESEQVRYRAALALARLRNPEAVSFIGECLHRERESRVTEMLLFALGQIGSEAAADQVLRFFASSIETVRAAAVEAAGKIKDPSLTMPIVERLLLDASSGVRAEACLALFRLGGKRFGVEQALPEEIAAERDEALRRALLEDQNPGVRWRAAYALADMKIMDPERELQTGNALRKAVTTDENIWVRAFSARALGAYPKNDATRTALVEACSAARATGEWNVAVEAINSLSLYTDLETAAQLIHYLLPGENASFHIRAAAARALGRFRTEGDTIVKALVRASNDPSRSVVGEAIVALGALGDMVHLEETACNEDRYIRLKTVEGLRKMGLEGGEVLLDLAQDESIRVRCAALEALADPVYAGLAEEIIPLAVRAVALDDLSLRYTGAELLNQLEARSAVPVLKEAYAKSGDLEMAEARLKIVEAVAALGGPEDVEFFREAVKDQNFHVQDTAAKALASISGELLKVDRETFVRQVVPVIGVDYMDGGINPVARLQTARGDVWIELFKEEAPTHVKNFIDLAESGFYNKLVFHRVVSNFVVQGLDPRGDGWGYNNTLLRDEINRIKFSRGYVGMPNSGPDTGGCQIFITHCPTPHLDGNYTVFGRVIAGMKAVDDIEEGDPVYRVTIK